MCDLVDKHGKILTFLGIKLKLQGALNPIDRALFVCVVQHPIDNAEETFSSSSFS